ncbi:ashwin [Conger conger]|uniref:ashwin n=1 Tax=Conger conger TaxID=82655 RepID=UPI002A5A87AE|nr:ashwin [Conger conger]
MADYNAGRRGKDLSTRKDTSSTDLLLHPELLSRDFIQLVLYERNIGGGDPGEASRDQLTDLYLHHVIPLPQRELPSSRWGRRVGQSRPRPAPGHACSSAGENTRKRPLIVFDSGSTRTGTVKLKKPDSGAALDRLKPPPCGNLANPIRKLSGPPSSPARTPASPPAGANRSPTGNGRMASPTAAVRVKRQAASEQESDSSGELRSPEVKKKIQHVTWP